MYTRHKKMIFHIAVLFDENALVASKIRPIKMLNAFKELGYDIFIVSGLLSERKLKVKELQQNINNGIKYDFLYSESNTMPVQTLDKNILNSIFPVDFKLFKICKKHKIPNITFYRDMYWKFGLKTFSKIKIPILYFFYWIELYNLNKYTDVTLLPSLIMGEYFPSWYKALLYESPPGCDQIDIKNISIEYDFIYVGGIGGHYDLELFIEVIQRFSCNVIMFLRKNDYNKLSPELRGKIELSNIKIIWDSKPSKEDFAKSRFALFYLKPSTYRRFAMPYKLFEYISYRIPIIASADTAVGNFVQKYNIGWVIEYNEEKLSEFLNLEFDIKKYNSVKEDINKVHNANTWQARCKKIVKIGNNIIESHKN